MKSTRRRERLARFTLQRRSIRSSRGLFLRWFRAKAQPPVRGRFLAATQAASGVRSDARRRAYSHGNPPPMRRRLEENIPRHLQCEPNLVTVAVPSPLILASFIAASLRAKGKAAAGTVLLPTTLATTRRRRGHGRTAPLRPAGPAVAVVLPVLVKLFAGILIARGGGRGVDGGAYGPGAIPTAAPSSPRTSARYSEVTGTNQTNESRRGMGSPTSGDTAVSATEAIRPHSRRPARPSMPRSRRKVSHMNPIRPFWEGRQGERGRP